ncbi:MAG: ECF-type sigma factor [Bryobacteraceae bacterium]
METGEITLLLSAWRSGSREAENKLFDRVLPDLRRLAHYIMSGERQGHSMQTNDLIDQIYFRMVAAKDRDWQNRQHFFALAARAMRRHLIDHARGRPDAKIEPLEKIQKFLPADSAKLELAITVDRLLNEMAEEKPEWARLVEVKYFLGLTDDEAADVLGVKLRTMQRMWKDARQWLFERMESGRARGAAAR